MITRVLTKIFGSRNDRLLKQYARTVARINQLESGVAALSDEALRAKTGEFKRRLDERVAERQVGPEVRKLPVSRAASGVRAR